MALSRPLVLAVTAVDADTLTPLPLRVTVSAAGAVTPRRGDAARSRGGSGKGDSKPAAAAPSGAVGRVVVGAGGRGETAVLLAVDAKGARTHIRRFRLQFAVDAAATGLPLLLGPVAAAGGWPVVLEDDGVTPTSAGSPRAVVASSTSRVKCYAAEGAGHVTASVLVTKPISLDEEPGGDLSTYDSQLMSLCVCGVRLAIVEKQVSCLAVLTVDETLTLTLPACLSAVANRCKSQEVSARWCGTVRSCSCATSARVSTCVARVYWSWARARASWGCSRRRAVRTSSRAISTSWCSSRRRTAL
jgi:hypothetical protein